MWEYAPTGRRRDALRHSRARGRRHLCLCACVCVCGRGCQFGLRAVEALGPPNRAWDSLPPLPTCGMMCDLLEVCKLGCGASWVAAQAGLRGSQGSLRRKLGCDCRVACNCRPGCALQAHLHSRSFRSCDPTSRRSRLPPRPTASIKTRANPSMPDVTGLSGH